MAVNQGLLMVVRKLCGPQCGDNDTYGSHYSVDDLVHNRDGVFTRVVL